MHGSMDMKKKIGIGCGILILSVLVWSGAKNINAAAKSKDSLGEIAVASASGGTSGGNVSETNADSTKSAKQEDGLLYYIKTSSGSSLGVVPIVNGNAVVLLDGSRVTIQQGEYTQAEKSAFALKVENETAKMASNGKAGAWTFYREPMLKDFVFPEGVTAIEKFAFARSGLKSVVIPEGVTGIGYGAFYHCDALTEVTIPKSVTVIEENAFVHTPWLKNWLARAEEGSGDAVGSESEKAGSEGATVGSELEKAGSEDAATSPEIADSGDFLIVGDGILLAYRGSEAEPELPSEVKSVVPGALGK